MASLGEFIKSVREEQKLTLREFANICNLSHSYISKLEKGIDPRNNKKVIPTIETLKKIADAVNYPLEKLLEISGYTDSTMSIDYNIPKEYKENHKIVKRDLNQYENFMEQAGVFFMNDEISEDDKERLYRDIGKLFWDAKEKNKIKYSRKKK